MGACLRPYGARQIQHAYHVGWESSREGDTYLSSKRSLLSYTFSSSNWYKDQQKEVTIDI